MLAFDQQSSLSRWTVADFQKLVASQGHLRLVVIPRYAVEPAKDTIADISTGCEQNGKKSKELRSLEKRRKAMARHDMRNADSSPAQKAIRDLDPSDLLEHVTMLLQLEVSDPAVPTSSREQEVFARCGAPLIACRQLLNDAKAEAKLHALEIAKDVNKLGVARTNSQQSQLNIFPRLQYIHLVAPDARHRRDLDLSLTAPGNTDALEVMTRKIAGILAEHHAGLTTLTCTLRSLRSHTSDTCHLRVGGEGNYHRRIYTEKALGSSLENFGEATVVHFEESLRRRL
jgi:hypothetical protein